ncbi:MAG: rRNA maturation RNase YbeY [Acutalibacteraceae bacterium]|nr:rRNA maturation RNase YbeY [Acutalibacteraceae bacterium]
MSRKVKVVITNDQKTVKIPKGMRLLIRRCCTAVLVMEEFPQDAEISVTIVDNEKIKELNKKYRDIDSETDVLSFPLGENGVYDINHDTGEAELGDIVLSLEKAQEQAEHYGHSLDREVGYLTVHSMLHLLGYNHEEGGMELVRMREKEEKVLTELGLRRDGNYYMGDE